MSWAVGWDFDHRRHRGYGVPAWCDAYGKSGCREEIDRGLGFVCDAHEFGAEDEPESDLDHTIYVCTEHTCADVDENNLPPEHAEWVAHVLSDESWAKWRAQEPVLVAEYQALMVAGVRAAQDERKRRG